MSKDEMKSEVKDVRKNYTRTPNILFESYSDLHPQEKWLYINLVYLCGSTGTRHLSLRYISQRTGISLGALSGSKDPNKNNPGMLRNLHNAGLIHAEIKKVKNRDGTEKDQAQYHITITDIWQMNINFFAERSYSEHLDGEGVHIPNAKRSYSEQERSYSEQERSEYDTNIRLHSKITKQEEEESKDTSAQPEPIATSHEVAAHTLFSKQADEQASLIAEAKSDGLQEESEKQEEKPASKSSSSQGKRRPPAKPVDETLKVRVERVYGYFDALAQETSGDATYRYQRTKKATAAITEWLKGTPTEELLREVYLELWNTPADIRSGFEWKRNMHIHSVLAQYDSRALAIKAKRHAAQSKPATVSPRPARHIEDDDEPLQYRTPQSQRNKNNRPFQAIAAARRV